LIRDGDPRRWMLRVPGETEREQCRVQGTIAAATLPTEHPALIADIVQTKAFMAISSSVKSDQGTFR